ncbi:MAG: hypothetical protein M1821_009047 [Bathelium mastoideum]|nr:MAG: hypothetical protein M1821_009047 [Bathelium mastoideum]
MSDSSKISHSGEHYVHGNNDNESPGEDNGHESHSGGDSNDSQNHSSEDQHSDGYIKFDCTEQLVEVVGDNLLKIYASGSFATFGKVENFVLPGLSVDSIGLIGLPLSEADARAIA